MARKTTKIAHKMLKHHDRAMKTISEWLRTKREVEPENQAEWLRIRSEESLIWQAHGMTAIVDALLREQNCYHGFMYIDSEGNLVRRDEPDFAEWRVRFCRSQN